MTAVPGKSFEGPLPPLTAEQARTARALRQHVRAIASVPHNVAHPAALESSARYIELQLGRLGFEVNRQQFGVGTHPVRNIEVVIEPADPAAETLVVGAHYDSCCDVPGANDNGTGVAALLELARELAKLRGQAEARVRLVFFVNEEPPFFKTEHMGSLVYARSLQRSGEKVTGMLSLETLGYYSDKEGSQHYPPPLGALYPSTGDFVAFVGLTSSRAFVRRLTKSFRAMANFPSEGGTAPAFVQGIDWSDHWSFEQVGIPAAMVTDSAPFRYPFYHDQRDRPDAVHYEHLARVTSGLSRVIRSWIAPTD
jgi:Zn-dependent M28 family amino/carboxypeptidase